MGVFLWARYPCRPATWNLDLTRGVIKDGALDLEGDDHMEVDTPGLQSRNICFVKGGIRYVQGEICHVKGGICHVKGGICYVEGVMYYIGCKCSQWCTPTSTRGVIKEGSLD